MLKSLASGVIAVILIYIIAGLYLPSEYVIRTDYTINQNTSQVFGQINRLSNWKNWAFDDSSAIDNLVYEGSEEGPGAIYTWHDEHSDGRMEIVDATPNKKVKLKLIRDFGEETSDIVFILVPQDSAHTEVTWMQRGDVGYDFRARFFIALGGVEKAIGGQNAAALKRMEKYLSKK